MEFEADDEEQALERLQEIWSALDWTLVPQEYDVHIEDMHLGRRLA
jgi:hypothetical protein